MFVAHSKEAVKVMAKDNDVTSSQITVLSSASGHLANSECCT